MRATFVAAATAAAALAACTGDSSSPGPQPSSAASTVHTGPSRPASSAPSSPWPTYHGDNQRTGVSTAAALRPPLRRAWSADLDGAVYAQPLVVGDSLLVATENNSVYSLEADTGKVQWRRHLGDAVPLSALPCGNIDPLGITGTPVYDETTGTVYAVTETTGAKHTLWALDANDGSPRWHRSLDVYADRDPAAEQQRGGLLLAHGRVYVAFGGLFGDCGNYVGYVAAVATDGDGPVLRYAVPTAREAGIWAPAGPVQEDVTGDILVASGNGAQIDGKYDGSDSVIWLSQDLRRRAIFTPDTWREDNAADLDLGSMSPVWTADHEVVIAGKRGTAYLVTMQRDGIVELEDTLTGCAAYGGAATSHTFVVLPCSDGLRRLDVTIRSFHWRWRAEGVAGSPVLARDVVYSLDLEAGALVQLDLETGSERGRVDVGAVSRFATPVPVDGRVYVGTLDGVVAVRGAA